jgi:hypothetical protein
VDLSSPLLMLKVFLLVLGKSIMEWGCPYCFCYN